MNSVRNMIAIDHPVRDILVTSHQMYLINSVPYTHMRHLVFSGIWDQINEPHVSPVFMPTYLNWLEQTVFKV